LTVLWAVVGLLAWWVTPCGAAAQSTSALVSQVRGEVKVRRAGQEAELPAKVGLRLADGDHVDVARGSRAVLLFSNGRLVTASTSLVVAPVGGAGADEIYTRAARSLEAAKAQERPKAGGGVGRPPPAGAYPLFPAFGTAVTADRPTFEWQPQDGAEGYLVQIRALAGGTPLRFRVTGAGPWSLPDSAAPLDRGAEYAWTVVPMPGGRFGGEERFRVMDASTLEELGSFHDALTDAGVDPEGDGLLVAAMFFADLGLLFDAERSLARLAEGTAESDRDPIVDLLHAQVLERLGRTAEATAAFDRAARGGR
jgi:hypothetical protein